MFVYFTGRSLCTLFSTESLNILMPLQITNIALSVKVATTEASLQQYYYQVNSPPPLLSRTYHSDERRKIYVY